MIKVPSLIFTLEMEERQDSVDENVLDVIEQMERFLAPADASEQKLMDDVQKHGLTDPISAASVLTGLGYNVAVRTALGGGGGADCLRNLRHSFVSCTLPGTSPNSRRRYIVDPRFKEQFVIAKPTSRYATILQAVPNAYVGPEEHLAPFVNFLCGELAAAFRTHGCVLPPWRQATSMLSKWKPRRSLDEPMRKSDGHHHSQEQPQQQQGKDSSEHRSYSRQDSGSSGSGKARRSSIAAMQSSNGVAGDGQDFSVDSAFRAAMGGPPLPPGGAPKGALYSNGHMGAPATAGGYHPLLPAANPLAVGSAPGCGMSGRIGANGFPGGYYNHMAAAVGAGSGAPKHGRKSSFEPKVIQLPCDFNAVPAS